MVLVNNKALLFDSKLLATKKTIFRFRKHLAYLCQSRYTFRSGSDLNNRHIYFLPHLLRNLFEDIREFRLLHVPQVEQSEPHISRHAQVGRSHILQCVYLQEWVQELTFLKKRLTTGAF